MKQKLLRFLPVLIIIAILLIPMPSSGLYLRLHFEDFEGTDLKIYYTTEDSPSFNEEHTILADIDETKVASFYLDSRVVDTINCLRLDFPQTSQLLSVKDVSVSSGGVVKHRFNPCSFFEEGNLDVSNNIDAMSISPALAKVFFQTGENDPYVVFSNPLLNKVLRYSSHYGFTRIAICMFLLGCYYFLKKDFFHSGKNKKKEASNEAQ